MTTIAKQPDDLKGVNRLLGMRVHETSLVDRAANKRTFLIVKKDGTMGANAVKKDENAGAPNAAQNDTTPAAAKLAPMQAQVKDALLQAISAAAQQLANLTASVKEAETTDAAADPAVPQSVTGSLGELGSMLNGLAAQYGGTAGNETKATGAAAPPPGKPGAEQPPAKPAQPGQPAAPAKAFEGVTENGGPEQQGAQKGAAPVAKIGRKMAKERLQRFRKVMDALAGIYKELTTESMRKSATPALRVIMPRAEVEALVASTEELVKRYGAALHENAELRKADAARRNAAQPSNALTPGEHGGGTQVKKNGGAVSWPLDMNGKLGRATGTGH